MDDLEDDFLFAVDRVQLLDRPPNDVLLKLYGLYKQATVGDVSGDRPGFTDPRGRAKHDAWATRKGMGKDDAKRAYITMVDELDPLDE
jgi:diazepam-binding inhibitor (GABA receptor modulating acyl-CoA-binding protein)